MATSARTGPPSDTGAHIAERAQRTLSCPGGIPHEEVRQAVGEIVAARQSEAVILHHGEREFSFVLGSASYEADIEGAVTDVMAVGRDRNILLNAWTHLSTLWSPEFEVAVSDDVFDASVRGWVTGIADAIDQTRS